MRIQSSFLGTLTLATLSLATLAAHAQSTEVSTTGKGTVGGTLLGAELVLSVEAAFKVQPTWAYAVGGLGGAAAGGVSGYLIEQNASPRTTLFMLAGGMAFAIPVTVAVLSATAYEPPASYTQDRAPADEPVAEPPQPAAAPTPATTISPAGNEVTAPAPVVTPSQAAPTTAPTATPPAPNSPPAPSGALPHRRERAIARRTLPLDYHLGPPALIGVSKDALTLGVPAIELRHVYSRNEIAMFGVSQATEVRVPVFNFLF
jgi:hypothetical protein